ncbi:hypothetical protein [Photobacterium sp. GB-36]|uniref:hypothetical protein n=1 Tax=Photobacterium sp. GB-36 TaxID=2022108 RepID=UPI000D1733BC|nr:hypothetical protein [Photobacterium sp. GB-36]PSV43086.1 hypothetical protein C9J46_13120 [Photobacterium sp. GB-36]
MKYTILFVLLASLAYTGCGGGSSDDTTNTTEVDTPTAELPPLDEQLPSTPENETEPTDDPEPKFLISDISSGYYDKLYDAVGNELTLDKDQVLSMQDALVDDVLPILTEEQQNTFNEAYKAFEDLDEKNEVDKVLFSNSMIDAMLSSADKATQDKYLTSFRLFRKQTHHLFPISRLGDYSWLFEFLNQRSWLTHIILIPPETTDDYAATCRENNVPIPPDWGSDLWVHQGTATTDFLASRRTEVYAYEDPSVAGTCMALPRWSLGASGSEYIQFLGIICQSKTTGKACFWDNISKETGGRITGGEDLTFKISDIQNGDNLAENCTNCHRGKNVFLIHPDTPIDISDDYDIDPNVRYQPISAQGWTNPPAFAELGDGACASCHEIGGISFDYCNTVLRSAANQTMPGTAISPDPAGWVGDDSFYGNHIQAMIDAGCPE